MTEECSWPKIFFCILLSPPFQVLNRLTYASALSHLRRCNAPLAKEVRTCKLEATCLSSYIFHYTNRFVLSMFLFVFSDNENVVFIIISFSICTSISVFLFIFLSVCLSVYLRVCLSIFLSVSLSVCLFVCLYICLSVSLSI